MAAQRRTKVPELIDMGNGLEPARYFSWSAGQGCHFCIACQKPCQSETHVSSRHHINHVWWWLEQFNRQWTQDMIEEIFATRVPNPNYSWTSWSNDSAGATPAVVGQPALTAPPAKAMPTLPGVVIAEQTNPQVC